MSHTYIIIYPVIETISNENGKTASYAMKTAILMLLLLLESYALVNQIVIYLNKGEYFGFVYKDWIAMFLLMTAIMFTHALTVGAWGKWQQFLIVPLPIALGAFLSLLFLETIYLALITMGLFLITLYYILLASDVRTKLIEFNPNIIFRSSVRGILFIYAILGGFLLFINTSASEDFDLIDKVGNLAGKQISRIVQPKLNPNPLNSTITDILSKIYGDNVDLDPNELNRETKGITESFGLTKTDVEAGIEEKIKDEVGRVLHPYRSFVVPLIALLIFGMLQFVGFGARIAFTLLSRPLFALAKRTGFLHLQVRSVDQEFLEF